MLMPPKGEYSMLPLNAQARAVANMWTPAQDAGNECRAYGAAAIMRVPGRLHIHWADDNTLQIDTDSGTQTRLLHFEEPPRGSRPTRSRSGKVTPLRPGQGLQWVVAQRCLGLRAI